MRMVHIIRLLAISRLNQGTHRINVSRLYEPLVLIGGSVSGISTVIGAGSDNDSAFGKEKGQEAFLYLPRPN